MEKLLVFYDGDCPFCRRTMHTLKKHDRRALLIGLNFRDTAVSKRYSLEGKNVEKRIYALQQKAGQDYSGVHALLEISKRVPLYWPLVPLIKLSILLGFGEACYDFVAARRQLIPVGKCRDGACRLPNQ